MQNFLKWTLDTIRKDGSSMSWMEEKRLEWVPIISSMLEKLLQGYTFIVLTDNEREWFGEYVIFSINKSSASRPFLPFVSIKSFLPSINKIKTQDDFALLDDFLNLSFAGGYTFFYIGKNDDIKCQIAKRKDDSLMWIMDEELQNSFYLRSEDEMLDIKLIQLFRLLNKSINAFLFAEVSFGDS